MFRRISGNPKLEWYPVTISTAFPEGGLTYWVSGELVPADATSGDHAGVIQHAIAATDDNYATARKVAVDVPNSDDIFEVDVETGTLTTAMIGGQYDLVADGDAIDVTATSKKVVTIVGFVSPSKALVKINAIAGHANVATS
jgi:hypothetical protein